MERVRLERKRGEEGLLISSFWWPSDRRGACCNSFPHFFFSVLSWRGMEGQGGVGRSWQHQKPSAGGVGGRVSSNNDNIPLMVGCVISDILTVFVGERRVGFAAWFFCFCFWIDTELFWPEEKLFKFAWPLWIFLCCPIQAIFLLSALTKKICWRVNSRSRPAPNNQTRGSMTSWLHYMPWAPNRP
jgi:hypothetical protein